MSARKPLIAANWKMHKTAGEAAAFLDRFLGRVGELAGADVLVCPAYSSLAVAVERCRRSRVRVAAQNMHDQPEGAYTGEVSAPMLVEAGVEAVILGHSERRALFNETDEALAAKVPAALDAGLLPILCVGETEAQRDADETHAVLRSQVQRDLAGVAAAALDRVVLAYEPVWAIGTGRNASPEQADEAIGFIRGVVAESEEAAAERVRIVYGGSVKAANATELFGSPQIDGGLIGGASLDPDSFHAICLAAVQA